MQRVRPHEQITTHEATRDSTPALAFWQYLDRWRDRGVSEQLVRMAYAVLQLSDARG